MERHVKKEYKVGLTRSEIVMAKELQRRECRIREISPEKLGIGTLLREHGVPAMAARLAELKAQEQMQEQDRLEPAVNQ